MQLDFGGFDQRFLGISVKVGSQRALDIVGGTSSGASGSTPLTPHGEFESIALQTVAVHEARHFHDFLLSPLGAATFRWRLGGYINAFGAIVALGLVDVLSGANTLPIPIPAWCRKDDVERRRLVSSWDAVAQGQAVDPHRVVDLPFVDDSPDLEGRSGLASRDGPMLQSLVTATSRYYARLREFLESPVPGLQTYHVSEASALLAQCQAVLTEHGEEKTNAFLGALTSQDAGGYVTPLKLLGGIFARNGQEFQIDAASTIVTWALLGNPMGEGGKDSSPVVRFARLGSHLTNERPAWDKPVEQLFASWDKALGCAPTLESLRESLSHDETFGPQMTRLVEEAAVDDAAEEPVEFAAGMFEMFREARRQCVERFLAAPEAYVHPLAYLESGNSLPAPSTLLVFLGGGIPNMKPQLEAEGWTVYRDGVLRDGTEIALAVSRPPGPGLSSPIDHAKALDAFDRLTLVDVLFSEFGRDFDQTETELARAALGQRGLRLRNLPA